MHKNKTITAKIIALLLIVTAVFCACSNGDTLEYNGTSPESDASYTAESSLTAADGEAEESSSANENSESSRAKKNDYSVSLETEKAKKAKSTATTTKKKSSSSKTKKTAKKSSSESTGTTAKSGTSTAADSAETTAKSQSESTESVCYLEIECKSILNNTEKLKSGHEKYVPSDGIILENYKSKISSSSTVYDILCKAADENDITLNVSKTKYSVYIAGINNLDEFDCGKTSGWIYSVNGKYPNKSCDKYTLSSGDKVIFSYTCS